MGEFGFAGWTVFMSSMIIFSTLLGIGLGRVEGRERPDQDVAGASLACCSWPRLLIIGYGNKLKAGEAKAAPAPPLAAMKTQRHKELRQTRDHAPQPLLAFIACKPSTLHSAYVTTCLSRH